MNASDRRFFRWLPMKFPINLNDMNVLCVNPRNGKSEVGEFPAAAAVLDLNRTQAGNTLFRKMLRPLPLSGIACKNSKVPCCLRIGYAVPLWTI